MNAVPMVVACALGQGCNRAAWNSDDELPVVPTREERVSHLVVRVGGVFESRLEGVECRTTTT
jgi:hypothetical protein